MTYSNLPSRSAGTFLALALTSSCVIPKGVGDGPDDGSGSGGSGGSDAGDAGDPTLGATTSVPTSEDEGSATVVPFDVPAENQCAGVPEFQCTEPVACDDLACGDPFSPFDADGCMRPPCGGPEDCDEGETCFAPIDHGGCASSGMTCSDGPTGACECVSDPDCGGRYCLPDADVPLECFGLPDSASCLDAGCTYFETVTEISDTCACTPGVPACLLFLGDEIGGPAAPDYFWHEATLTVALFSTSWIEVPVGWRPCTDPDAPPACDCYEPFDEPACP